MRKKFIDNAEMPIIAFDFDDTINIEGTGIYPDCGKVRPYAKEIIDFMHKLGIKIIIWTSRDVAYNQEEKKMYDHMSPMIEWLDKNKIYYDAINKSIQYAPYHYNGRKIYAHMYVDDRGFGWYGDICKNIMIDVFKIFIHDVCGLPHNYADKMEEYILAGKDPEPWMIEEVKLWKTR